MARNGGIFIVAAAIAIAGIAACQTNEWKKQSTASGTRIATPAPAPTGATSTSAATRRVTATATTTRTATATATRTVTAPAGSSGTKGGVPRCTQANSTWTLDANDAGTTNVHYLVQVTPTGASCRVYGYPGVSLVHTDQGRQLGADAQRVPPQGRAVVLRKGQHATAEVTLTLASTQPGCTAREARGWRIIPPDTDRALFVPMGGVTGCTEPSIKLLTVRPFEGPIA